MSDNLDSHAIDYRALVTSFARELTAEEIYEVAYIWLSKQGDVSKYSPSSKPKTCGLEVFARLECCRIFSRKNIGGLIDIAKRINRYDLVEKVEAFTKKNGNRCATRYQKKKASYFSEERQELEQMFGTMVTQMAVLEQHISLLQNTLQKSDGELLDEGMEIVHYSGDIAQKLATNLNQVYTKLARRSRSDSSMSGSSDGSRRSSKEDSELTPLAETTQNSVIGTVSTGVATPTVAPPMQVSTTQQVSNGQKPVPKPRSPKTPSRSTYREPIQESPGHPSQLLYPLRTNGTECADTRLSHALRLPPPVPPKRPVNTSAPSTHHRLSTATRNTPQVVSDTATIEEDDWTGDSGMGTGSGSAQYGAVLEWRQALKHPPPVKPKKEHFYTPIRGHMTDEDQVYQELNRSHS